MHDPVDPNVDFPALERAVLDWWRETDVPARSLTRNEGGAEYVFYEGPPTANNPPGLHHVLARAYKDVYTRFQAMKGLHVPRKAGWDCHGLPVEIEVEKRLGFTQKQQIAEYGVGRFNQLCRESVTEYVTQWVRASERMAFWLDYDDAYWTMSNDYIESVWWSLAELHRRGLLYEGYKVAPYCPRCETPLSDHELGQPGVYKDVPDPGVTVAFPLVDPPPGLEGAALCVWTTTPWTLISNLAVAVHPDISYAVVAADGRRLVVAEALVEPALGLQPGTVPERTMPGSALLGLRYAAPFEFTRAAIAADQLEKIWTVLPADYVTTQEGTGLVHLASFGAEDVDTFRAHGIEGFAPVDGAVRFDARVPPYQGMFVKDADPAIIEDLRARGLLVRDERIVHSYPHCWRCDSPLIQYPLTSWYVRTTQFRDRLLEVNAGVNWVPQHIRDGRYGNWLANNVDWSLSRYRFWGTPLPIWRCPNAHDVAVASLADLTARAGRDLSGLDLHRPYVDDVAFACPDCGAEARRVKDLIDVWYDSGAMPYAQYGYPHKGVDKFKRRFPADFISEAIDQTRGWFYSLMAEATLLFDDTSYRNVVCLEFIVDADGRKMSKSLGNVIDPWELFERYGSDAVRFYLLTGSAPAQAKRVSFPAVEQVVRGTFLTLWNVYRLYVQYANIDEFDPNSWEIIDPAHRPPLDRWVLSELHQTMAETGEALANYDCTRAGRRIAAFVDDLSRWYVRRSRRRFWREAETDEDEWDKTAAYFTLWTCLSETAAMLAPFTPFLSDAIYRNLVAGVNPDAPPSVHLTDFPTADARIIDVAIASDMAVVRTLCSLGLAARDEAGVKVRRPLARALLLVPEEYRDGVEALADLVADELNVKDVEFASDAAGLVRVTLKPNFRNAGPDFGPKVRELGATLAALGDEAAGVAERLESGLDVDLDVSGERLTVGPEHVEIRREPAQGTAFCYQAPFGVSIDLEVSAELRREGLVRELVHHLQNLRRTLGLEITDRVKLSLDAAGELAEAVAEHDEYLVEELLVTEMGPQEARSAQAHTLSVEDHAVVVRMERDDEES